MQKKSCYTCKKILKEDEDTYPVIIVDKEGIRKTIGYECIKCYQASIPDEVWEDLDKFHSGI